MGYNAELQSNNADLQDILDAVNALEPAAGYKTCTVTISLTTSPSASSIDKCYYTRIVDNQIEAVAMTAGSYGETVTLTNVLCGSIISVAVDGVLFASTASLCISLISNYDAGCVSVVAPATSGGSGYIDLEGGI